MSASARIGPYRVTRLIHQGGQGGVYLGYDARLQRRVAIKIYSLPSDRPARKRLLAEAQLIARIDSEKVCRIYDLVVGRDNIAMVMEHVSGCNLQEFLAAVKPSVGSVLMIARDLAGAIAAARNKGIVHGDIKAANVLISDRGNVKLTDFGIARSEQVSAASLSLSASPSSVSPEQYQGQSLDVRSDLFSLGALMYRMLAGFQPFFAEGQLDPAKLLNQDPQPLDSLIPNLPPGLSDLVAQLLEKNPDDRPQDTLHLRHALRAISRHVPLSAKDSLLREASSCFVENSASDLPPQLPADLRHSARSHLKAFVFSDLSTWNNVLPGSFIGRFALLSAPLIIGTALVVYWLSTIETRIHIEQPKLELPADTVLPAGFSQKWLVEQVKPVAGDLLGEIIYTGPVGATPVTTLYAVPPQFTPDESLSLALRCAGQWCRLQLSRSFDDVDRSFQALLSPGDSLEEWGAIVADASRKLYY